MILSEKHRDGESTYRGDSTENSRTPDSADCRRHAERDEDNCMEDGSREAHRTGNGKAATGPPVTAERYKKEISVPGEVSAVRRK